jgi:CDP-glucose 4,6-dehydratase
MKNIKSFFYKKKIIITGHTGFKGSWLTLSLVTYGANVYGISKDIPTNPSHFKTSLIYKGIKNYKLDILNKKELIKIFKKIQPDYVFHLAAQSLVGTSYRDPSLTWNTNLIGTLNVLESLRKLKKKCIAVLITSDKCYLNKEVNKGYKETDILGGDDQYSASKAASEILITSYIKSFFKKNNNNKIRISTARAGNVIGGGDWSSNRLIPDCIKQWGKKRNIIIKNPLSTRPWQHVLEAVFGYIFLATNLAKNNYLHGESFNFGPSKNSNYNVISVVRMAKKFWKDIKWSIKKKKSKSFKEANLLRLNINKAKRILGWKPMLKFDKSISMTIDWYKNYYFKIENNRSLSMKQIKYYKEIFDKPKKNNDL